MRLLKLLICSYLIFSFQLGVSASQAEISPNSNVEALEQFDQNNLPPSDAQDLSPQVEGYIYAQKEEPSQQVPQEVEANDDSDYQRAIVLHQDLLGNKRSGDSYRSGSAMNKVHVFEFGPEVYQFEYQEPGVMREKGWFYGAFLNYTYRPDEKDQSYNPFLNVFKVDGRLALGQVDYDSYGTGILDDVDDFAGEVRGTLGNDFYACSSFRMTPYAGFGFRYLNDDSGGERTSSGHFGYERESHYLYVPIGIELTTKIDTWTFSLIPEFDFFIQGTQKSHLSDVSSIYGDIENDQDDGYGLRGSFRITKEFSRMNLVVEPFVRYWHIDDSEISTSSGVFALTGLEPDNKTMETGVRIGAQF